MSLLKIFKNIILSAAGAVLLPVFLSGKYVSASDTVYLAVFSVLVFALLFYADKQQFSLRLKLFSLAPGFIFSVMTAFGYSFDVYEKVDFGNVKFILSIVVFAYIFAVALRSVWDFIEQKEPAFALPTYKGLAARLDSMLNWLYCHRLVMAAVMLLCWLPCWLSIYPGNFRYDAASEFRQSYEGYNGDFPLLHSFITIKLLTTAFEVTGSYNLGIAIYIVAQMILLGTLFSHIIHSLNKQGINRFFLLPLFAYYAVFPSIHLLVTCNVRDVMFSGMLVWSVFLLYRMCTDYKKFMSRWLNPFMLALVLVITILSRNNNTGIVMPAALAVISFAVIVSCRKINLKGAVIFAATAFISYFVLSAGLVALCQPLVPAKASSSLSICSQSLARAYYYDRENWSQDELDRFFEYFPNGKPYYVAENADPTKFSIVIPEDGLGDFMDFWMQIGKKYPSVYLNAFLANSRQMWFPDVVIDGYKESGASTFKDFEKCYFTFKDSIEKPGQFDGKLPLVHQFYNRIAMFISFEKIPFVSLLFSIGFHFWLLINCCFYAVYRKSRHLLLPLAILMGYSLISAFVPLVLLRYFAALFFAFPLIAAWSVQPDSAKHNII